MRGYVFGRHDGKQEFLDLIFHMCYILFILYGGCVIMSLDYALLGFLKKISKKGYE